MILYRCDVCGHTLEARYPRAVNRISIPKDWTQTPHLNSRGEARARKKHYCPKCALTLPALVPPGDSTTPDEDVFDFVIRLKQVEIGALMEPIVQQAYAEKLYIWLTTSIPSGIYRRTKKLIQEGIL